MGEIYCRTPRGNDILALSPSRRQAVRISSARSADIVHAGRGFRRGIAAISFPYSAMAFCRPFIRKTHLHPSLGNDILSAFGRYQPAADDIAVPATISSPSRARTERGTKCRKTICPCRSYPTRAGNSIQWSIVNYLRRRRAARPIRASRLSVVVVGSGMRSSLYFTLPSAPFTPQYPCPFSL